MDTDKTPSSALEKLLTHKRKIDNKLKLEHFFVLIIILVLPLAFLVSKQQQNGLTKAQDRKALASSTLNLFADEDFESSLPASEIKPVSDKDKQDTLLSSLKSSVSINGGASKPNIIVIMLDDFPPMDGRLWNYLPTIKSLISQGAEFTNYYGETPLCCPGRAGFLTGQHTLNHGVNKNSAKLFNPTMTIATQLQKSGYYTFVDGKYFNFTDLLTSKTPPGWDQINILGEGSYYNYNIYNNGVKVFKATAPQDYSTDVISNKAILDLKQAPATKPIFAYIAPYATHADESTPQYPVPALRHLSDTTCNSAGYWNPANYNEADVSDKPAYIQSKPLLPDTAGWDLTADCKALLSVDELVKRVKDELIVENRFDNTMFVIMADNGMDYGAHRLTVKRTPYSTPLPLFIYWPAKFGTTPSKINSYVENIDFAPTFCVIAGCSMGPYPNGQTKADGASFIAQATGQFKVALRDTLLESQPIAADEKGEPSWFGVRTTSLNSLGLWHYIENESGEKELYNLSNGPCYLWDSSKTGDPCELNNLLSPNIVLPPGETVAHINTLKIALSQKLAQLKVEKGFTALVVPTTTPNK